MFILNPIYKYLAIGIAILGLFGAGYYKGYSAEKERFDAFKIELEAQAKAQELVNDAKKKQQDIIAKSIGSQYEAKLSALKSYYNGMRQPSADKLSTVPNATFSIDGKTTDSIFTGQCAKTTLMLVNLQEWITEVSKTNQ